MSRPALIALVCLFVAFAGSLIVSRTVFERLPHLEDEFAYLYQARLFAEGHTHIETPPPRRAYWQPFLLDVNGHRFGKYPPGWPLLLAVGVKIGAPWIVNTWIAMLTVALVYRLGRALDSPATGAVAALLLATSPAALLLNGSLMAHTAGLLCAVVFLYAVLKAKAILPQRHRGHGERNKGRMFFSYHFSLCALCTSAQQRPSVVNYLFWPTLAGLALGWLVITRPLTALGVAAPVAVCCAARMGRIVFRREWCTMGRIAAPLVILAGVALLVGLIWPWFNYTVSGPKGESFPAYLGRFVRGDPDTDLYRRVWPYDRVGFGPGHGRAAGGHTLARGLQHAREDLDHGVPDLFGWGYASLIPVILGVLVGWRRGWVWLLAGIPANLIAVHMAYWVGGSLYSARYYFESLGAVVILAGLGIASPLNPLSPARRWRRGDLIARRFAPPPGPDIRSGRGDRGRFENPFTKQTPGRARQAAPLHQGTWIGAVFLLALTLYSLIVYTPDRLESLRGYGHVSRDQIAAVNDLRQEPDRPLLVIAYGPHDWREVAALMAITTPYRDGDIVLARDPTGSTLETILAQWPDREVIYYAFGKFTAGPVE